jgi:hypothetical protein
MRATTSKAEMLQRKNIDAGLCDDAVYFADVSSTLGKIDCEATRLVLGDARVSYLIGSCKSLQ